MNDRSLWAIVSANALTAVFALWQDWGVLQLMWPFWMQSVIIGVFATRRILALEHFDTSGFKFNGRPVQNTAAAKRSVAGFFVMHYGLFHLVYLGFLAGMTFAAGGDGLLRVTDGDSGAVSEVHVGTVAAIDWLLFLALAVAFWFSHAASRRAHLQADLAGRPNIGTLMFLPYPRILPMHITLIAGLLLEGRLAVILFLVLKTVADAGMHVIEHRLLAKKKATADDVGPSA